MKMREFKYDVVQLLEGIRDRPCLWDKTKDNYKDRVERRNAWEEIFNMLEVRYDEMTAEEKRLTGENILNKWTNIRDTFMKSLKTRMGKPKRRYVLYQHLKFLTKIRPEECTIEQNELMDESNEGIPYDIPMKQEIDSVSPESSEANYRPDTSKNSDFDDSNSNFAINETDHCQKKKSKRKEFDNTKGRLHGESSCNRKKSKRFSIEMNDSKDVTYNKKKSKTDSSKANNNDDYINDDIDFVAVDETDNPRVMNEDEAFFASLLPTVVKYGEDERLEFRIEVLKVMKRIKDERKCFES